MGRSGLFAGLHKNDRPSRLHDILSPGGMSRSRTAVNETLETYWIYDKGGDSVILPHNED